MFDTQYCELHFPHPNSFSTRDAGLPTGGTRGDQWSPWEKKKKIRGDQGGPGGTSLPLSVPRLPVRNFPHFF